MDFVDLSVGLFFGILIGSGGMFIYSKLNEDKSENKNENDVGVAIAIGSRLVSLDIFFNNNLLKVYLSKIIRSVVLDSYKKNYYQNFINEKNVHKLLRLIEQSEKKMHKTQSGCLGEEIRFNSDQVVGSCLYFENKMLHFSGFLKDDMNIPQFKSKVA